MPNYSRVYICYVPPSPSALPTQSGEGDVAERRAGTVYARGLDGVPYGTIDAHWDHVEGSGFVGGFGYFEEVFVDLYADAGGVG